MHKESISDHSLQKEATTATPAPSPPQPSPPAATPAKPLKDASPETPTKAGQTPTTEPGHRAPNDTPKVILEETVCLKKELGLFEGITMIVGTVIGSGIFVSPKGVIEYSGSVGMSLIVWAACGMMSTVGALCFAELGTMIPESGGMFSYLMEAFGPVTAFLYMWLTVVIRNAAGMAVVAITFANYLLEAVVSECEVPDVPRRLIAAGLIGFLTWVNSMNVKWAANIQNVFTVTKVLALVLIIVMGINHLASGHLDNYRDPMHGTSWAATAISTAFYQSLFSYGGWEKVTFLVEEMKNSSRNMPLAILIATSLVTIIYTLTNVAYFAVLSPAEMISSSAVAMSFAARTLGVLAWTMPLFVTCSTFGGMNGGIFTQARLIFVGARRGHFPEALSLLHATRFTPIPAVVFNGILCLLMLVTSDVVVLINYSTFCYTLTHFGCVSALLWLRYKQPERSRPFKVWLLLPILYWLTQLFLMVFPLIANPVEVGASIGIIATGLPLYYLAIYRKDIADRLSKPLGKLTYLCQLLFLGLPEKKMD
ncbi:Y+L amino acid transporter 2-like [Panulirus ornatus]|uniref:Y+L amino acid transporter 2-like n=1 Tax=Panulirus ornatus TaxID=150431 RepID=UPI003A8C39A7